MTGASELKSVMKKQTSRWLTIFFLLPHYAQIPAREGWRSRKPEYPAIIATICKH
jgi:hypothetical protein